MAGLAWGRLERAGDQPDHPMRVVVLATTRADGTPDARLMVLRGASKSRRHVWFHTDVRSSKVEDLRHTSTVSVVAWDPTDRVQLRLTGRATVEDRGETVEQHFGQVAMGARALFASREAPGRPLSAGSTGHAPDPRLSALAEVIDAGEEDWARRHFAVIEVTVDVIEWLQVDGPQQRRAIMRARSGWAVEPLVP